ncbi:hypothetical protein I7I50_08743 [Histoplasma capsulatum G186AR]|uniref:Uncharacterized protein n=1 Tax=Ajellomyces capsulatus TaxID=5037 RepID=A0A8H7YTF8_AJECA|nr:hypothetical protein I7I52_06257 [Histoplasma capsulatum]QSS73825.1 hypothetical protein I7I50_08743 [Histoplasma capsulatum G186AR]
MAFLFSIRLRPNSALCPPPPRGCSTGLLLSPQRLVVFTLSKSSCCFPCKKEKLWKFWKFTSPLRSIVIGFVKWYFEILV